MAREAGPVLNETDIDREWAPQSDRKQVVACCWEQRVSAARVQRILPDGHADLIINDTGRVEVVGLHDLVALPALPAAPICQASGSVPLRLPQRSRSKRLRRCATSSPACPWGRLARPVRSQSGR